VECVNGLVRDEDLVVEENKTVAVEGGNDGFACSIADSRLAAACGFTKICQMLRTSPAAEE
jgi:hypothetical protein